MEDLGVHAVPFIKTLQAAGIGFFFFYFPNKIIIQKKVIEDHEHLTLDNILYLRLFSIATLGQRWSDYLFKDEGDNSPTQHMATAWPTERFLPLNIDSKTNQLASNHVNHPSAIVLVTNLNQLLFPFLTILR